MPSISDFQQQVVALVADGRNNDEIATSLQRSEEEIERCIADLLHQLGLSRRIELLLWFHSQHGYGDSYGKTGH
jgi:DNA-binding NarL/FixJ family response regulator